MKQDLIELFVSLQRWQWRHVTGSLAGDLGFLGFWPRFSVSKALFILLSCVTSISCDVASQVCVSARAWVRSLCRRNERPGWTGAPGDRSPSPTPDSQPREEAKSRPWEHGPARRRSVPDCTDVSSDGLAGRSREWRRLPPSPHL